MNTIKIIEVSCNQQEPVSAPAPTTEQASVTQFESDIDVITADFIEQLLDIQMEGFSIDDILDPGSFKMLRDEILGVLKSYGLEVEPIPDPDEDEKKEYEFKFDNEEYEFKFDFE